MMCASLSVLPPPYLFLSFLLLSPSLPVFAISNFSAMIMIVVSFVLQYTVLGQPLDVMFWSVVGIVALPVVMALLSSPIRSFPRLVFGSYLIYLLLTPTFVGGFLLYADARLWDLR